MLCSVVLLALFASVNVQGRAVNISNTWVLPEEGFPVFYRYFRDRISWYEADAVCQFHHANLVTVDTTAQYDAVRAYLKELDISSAVWVGLIRSNPDGDFTWTDYRGLSGDGYWSSAPDARSAPLCAAADPSADYRWEARACGGPTVASFICELPVPQWALGNEGCTVRELPALTILYLPESAAVQLTADCGLAGVKRVQCTGNVKREDLLKNLSCDEDLSTISSLASSSYAITTETVLVGQDSSTDLTIEENTTTEHEDDINQSSSSSSPSTENYKHNVPSTKLIDEHIFNNIILDKNIDLSNNLQSNYIPKIATGNYLTNEELDAIEDEKHMQHKMLHEEIARLGNPENIFTQPTDHFVPPLVMAKARISDDMTVLSLQEKHAQQLAEQQNYKQDNKYLNNAYASNTLKSTTEETKITQSNNKVYTETDQLKDSYKKDKLKTVPKKFYEKVYDLKRKILKTEFKPSLENHNEKSTLQPESTSKYIEATTSASSYQNMDEDPSIDLTVILKDSSEMVKPPITYNKTSNISKLEIIQNSTRNNETEMTFIDVEATEHTKHIAPIKHFEEKIQNITLNHEVIKITIISESHGTPPPTTVFEVTTKMANFADTTVNNVMPTVEEQVGKANDANETSTRTPLTTQELQTELAITVFVNETDLKNDSYIAEQSKINETILTTTPKPFFTTPFADKIENTSMKDVPSVSNKNHTHNENLDFASEFHEDYENNNSTDSGDDFQSPLLSGANEPLRRPNRTRRPQPLPNRSKFNPFRILG